MQTARTNSIRTITILLILTSLGRCSNLPDGMEGEKAEQLTTQMLEAAGLSAWEKTQAVAFTFAGRRSHLWDRKRGFVEYRNGDTVVHFSKETFKGIAYERGIKIYDEGRTWKLIEEANSAFINDIFWLQPIFHLRAPGARRYYVEPGMLRVTFSSGGVTPGDSYVFIPDESFRLSRMLMWVKIIPTKGAEAEFKEYVKTETGVSVAIRRSTAVKDLVMSDMKFFPQFPVPGQRDPFNDLTD